MVVVYPKLILYISFSISFNQKWFNSIPLIFQLLNVYVFNFNSFNICLILNIHSKNIDTVSEKCIVLRVQSTQMY